MTHKASAAEPEPASGAALPPEARLSMPRHAVHEPAQRLRERGSVWALLRTLVARMLVIAVTAGLSAYGIREMYGVLSTGEITPLQWAFLLLFALNFSWIASAFAQALQGFLSALLPRWRRPSALQGPLPFRTAVLVPVYNEEPRRIAAAIRSMRSGLAQLEPGQFAFFILSDSNRAEAWLEEEQVFRSLTEPVQPDCPVYYRHRANNAERKAGNIAEWVQRWGSAYEAMIVLDADSVMAPQALSTLSRRLAVEPGLGLIQTLPFIVRGRSLYARLQQFANHCYGPVYALGLAAWHGRSSNFWGHNAIIRTRSFAEAACLPVLKGEPPLGGHILSHDFIEAALLRRAGWGVRFDCDIGHSFEEAPPSLADVIVRDRRWCQGNLQHSRFLFARGLSFPTRLHLLSGIMSYLSAVLWLALVLLGLAIAVQASLVRPEYFAEPSLFPTWPVFDAERARWLFGISMAVLLAPKWFGGVLALLQPRRLMAFGGPLLLPLSLLLEILLSALYAPILMLAQTRVVWQVLRGHDGGWQPQSREDGTVSLLAALRAHAGHTLFGAVLAGVAWLLNPELFFWLLPITAGLLLAIPLSWLSGDEARGRVLFVMGLLRAPEEKRPCDILSRLQSELEEPREPAADRGVLTRLQMDPQLLNWHLAQLPELPAAAPENYQPEAVTAAWKSAHSTDLEQLERWLTPAESTALLRDGPRLRSLLEPPTLSAA